MKKILFLLSVIFAFATALAQSPTSYTLGGLNGGTNVVSVATTNSPGTTFNCSDFVSVGLQFTCAAASAGTSIVTFRVAESMDGTTYETTPSHVYTLTLNGTTPVTVINTLSIPSCATLKLTTVENTNASVVVTNVAAVARFKSGKVQIR